MSYLNPHTHNLDSADGVDPLLRVVADVVAERRRLVEELGQGAEGPDDELRDDECWPWKGNCDRDGYGLKTYQGRQWRIHRLAFMIAVGEDPGDLDVLHRCDNPPCFRPSHLYAGTNLDNVRDKVERGRARNQHTGADACIYRHPFDDANTYINPASGNRQCRQCRRQSNALDKRLAKYPKATAKVLREVFRERVRQDFVFDEQNHPDGTGLPGDAVSAAVARTAADHAAQQGQLTWRKVLAEEVFEAFAETDPALLRAELVQVAAVATAWVEAIDRREVSR